MISGDYRKHPIWAFDGMIGIQGYSLEDVFVVPANGENHFLLYGIAENSLLLVDRKKPFADGKLNVFQTDRIVNGEKQMKLSLTQMQSAPYIGRVVMTLNHYD